MSPIEKDSTIYSGQDEGTISSAAPCSYLRPHIHSLKEYTPGEQPGPDEEWIKLNTNENPYPPSPRVSEAIIAALHRDDAPGSSLRLYSDPNADLLREEAARSSGLPLDAILAGNGSDELLSLLIRATVDNGQCVVCPYPTYVLYRTLTEAHPAEFQSFDFNNDFSLPRELARCAAQLIFIANPNSPSGTAVSLDEIQTLAQKNPQAIVAVDEAYATFCQESALSLVRRGIRNIVVLQTLSKGYSLAGLRIGILYGPPDILGGIRKIKDSYNLDSLAISGGAAALADRSWTARNTARIIKTRSSLSNALRDLGLDVLPSEANFVFVRFANAAAASAAFRHLRDHRILVRYFAQRLLDTGLRITVGTDEQIHRLVEILQRFTVST